MYFLGVDIGGTKTAVAIADENGEVLSVERGKGSNHQGCGMEESYKIINETLTRACNAIGIEKGAINSSFFGIAGADLDYDYKIINSILERLKLNHYEFDNDGLIALRAGSTDGTGILITCGTGSISFANNGKKIIRKGGFSRFFGERLGGKHVAGLVASAIVRGEDGRGPKSLMHELLKRDYSVTIYEMMKKEYPDIKYTVPDINISLINTLYKAAHLNDFAAIKVLVSLTEEILTIVNSFRADLIFQTPIKLILEGSVFKNADSILIDLIKTALGKDYQIIIPTHDPVIGALLFAAGRKMDISEDYLKRIVNSYNKKVGKPR